MRRSQNRPLDAWARAVVPAGPRYRNQEALDRLERASPEVGGKDAELDLGGDGSRFAGIVPTRESAPTVINVAVGVSFDEALDAPH